MDEYLAGPSMIDYTFLISLCTLMAVLVISSYTELKEKRIPNWVTISGLLIGLLAGYFPGGITLTQSISGFVVGFFFLFVFYMFGGMGGGDVKLMGAVGALQGYPLVMNSLVYTAFIGGAMAIWVLVSNQHFWRGMGQSMAMFFRIHKPEEEQAKENEEKLGTVPYGIAIISGTSLTIVLSML